MARYRMEDGTVLDTDRASRAWSETASFDGHNMVSDVTGSQWTHQTLYCSRRGRYYIEHTSQWQGSRSYAEWIGPETAAAWLLACSHDLPDDLAAVAEEITE